MTARDTDRDLPGQQHPICPERLGHMFHEAISRISPQTSELRSAAQTGRAVFRLIRTEDSLCVQYSYHSGMRSPDLRDFPTCRSDCASCHVIGSWNRLPADSSAGHSQNCGLNELKHTSSGRFAVIPVSLSRIRRVEPLNPPCTACRLMARLSVGSGTSGSHQNLPQPPAPGSFTTSSRVVKPVCCRTLPYSCAMRAIRSAVRLE